MTFKDPHLISYPSIYMLPCIDIQIDEQIEVSATIDKLQDSWKELGKILKHI